MGESMKLLYKGDSNWDYYLNEKHNYIRYVAKKGSGADDGVFGSIQYFSNWLMEELNRKPEREARVTKYGFGLIPNYSVK